MERHAESLMIAKTTTQRPSNREDIQCEIWMILSKTLFLLINLIVFCTLNWPNCLLTEVLVWNTRIDSRMRSDHWYHRNCIFTLFLRSFVCSFVCWFYPSSSSASRWFFSYTFKLFHQSQIWVFLAILNSQYSNWPKRKQNFSFSYLRKRKKGEKKHQTGWRILKMNVMPHIIRK